MTKRRKMNKVRRLLLFMKSFLFLFYIFQFFFHIFSFCSRQLLLLHLQVFHRALKAFESLKAFHSRLCRTTKLSLFRRNRCSKLRTWGSTPTHARQIITVSPKNFTRCSVAAPLKPSPQTFSLAAKASVASSVETLIVIR